MSEPDPRRWKALAVSLAAGFMSLLDVSIVNEALPSVQNGLNATAGSVHAPANGTARSAFSSRAASATSSPTSQCPV